MRDRQLNQHVLERWRKYLRGVEGQRRAGVPACGTRRQRFRRIRIRSQMALVRDAASFPDFWKRN